MQLKTVRLIVHHSSLVLLRWFLIRLEIASSKYLSSNQPVKEYGINSPQFQSDHVFFFS